MWEQLPYIARVEAAGVPTVLLTFEDQLNMVRHTGQEYGVPNVRTVSASRMLPGPADVDTWVDALLAALTRPLSDAEKKGGRWEPPQDRILFEGTLDEARIFYQQTRVIPTPVNAPMCVYTDGFPIVIPTEELVKEMLTGTSHAPDDIVTHQRDIKPLPAVLGAVMAGSEAMLQLATKTMGFSAEKGEVVYFHPNDWTATVERVAAVAVMAGCKPEHLPVVLAIAESGCRTSTSTKESINMVRGLRRGIGGFGQCPSHH